MLSTLIFDELSVQTMLQTKQFANQRFTPTGLLILRGDLLSFFRMCEVETKLFHTWQETGTPRLRRSKGCLRKLRFRNRRFRLRGGRLLLILSHKRHGLYLHPQVMRRYPLRGGYITWQELAFYDNSSKLPSKQANRLIESLQGHLANPIPKIRQGKG